MASYLRNKVPERVVAVCQNHPFHTIISLLGVLVSGKAFWIVSDEIFKLRPSSVSSDVFLLNDDLFQKALVSSQWSCEIADVPGTLPFCWTTSSGSLATPRITEYSYYSIMEDTARQVESHGVTDQDRLDVISSLSFSASLSSIFPALLAGASLHIKKPTKDLSDIYDFWRKEEITMTTLIPSVFRALLKLPLDLNDLKIRFICISGEHISPDDFNRFRERFGRNVVFQAALASSETRLIGEFIATPDHPYLDGESLVYDPVPGKALCILDKNGDAVEPGSVGLISVISKMIGSGYVNSDRSFRELSDGNRMFVSDDKGVLGVDGKLKVVKDDTRIRKYRGEYLDLDMLEHKLLDHPQILECYTDMSGYAQALHIYIHSLLPPDKARSEIKAIIGSIPFQLHQLRGGLPKLYSGKVDRQALTLLAKEEDEVSPLMEENTTLLHSVWKKLFPHENNFIGKHFFDNMGGDSMTAVEFSVVASKIFGKHISTNTVYQYPVFEALADHLTDFQSVRVELISKASEDAKNILIFSWLNGQIERYRGFLKELKGGYNFYTIKYPIEENGEYLSTEEICLRCADFLESQPLTFHLFVGYSYPGLLTYTTAVIYKKVKNVMLVDTPTYRKVPFTKGMFKEAKRGGRYLYRYLFNMQKLKRGADLFVKVIRERSVTAEITPGEASDRQMSYHEGFEHKVIAGKPRIPQSDFQLGVLIASDQSMFTYRIEPDFSWEKYNSNLLFKDTVEGDHMSIMHDENVHRVTNALKTHF